MNLRRLFPLLIASLLVVACSGSDGSSSDNGDSSESQSVGNPTTCGGGCPDGQFCFNGVCAVGCNSDSDCADNQYCATEEGGFCHNKEVPECTSDGDCTGDQICQQELCVAEPEQPDECEPSADGNDGCGKYSICVEEDSGNKCYSLPKCSADDTCPTGAVGAVCNTDYIPNKAEVCLIGLCESQDDCAGGFNCQRVTSGQELGICSPETPGGGSGDSCTEDSDCDGGEECFGATGGFEGTCM
jgi:hypothetical protein